MSVHDLLLALMLPSADDAAEDLAYNVGDGSVRRFVGMMNAEARRLGLHDTHYSTPIGLDTPGNYSTAGDLVKLAAYDLSHSAFFARIVALKAAVLHTGNHVRTVVNRNDLVAKVPWINGVKTGHTLDAGYVLVASGHRDGMKLLSAVLGTSSEASRDANTLALLDYGFANFHIAKPVRAGQVLARPTVRYRRASTRRSSPRRPFHARHTAPAAGCRSSSRRRASSTGPLRRRAVVGSAVVLAGDGRSVARVPLLLAQSLPAVSPLTIAARFITKPLMLLLLAALAGVPRASVRARRRRRGAGGQGRIGASMIITVTLNAAMDKTLEVPSFTPGRRHRTVDQTTMPGGKGVNIARAIKQLGQPVIATGFAGGATGTRIVEALGAESILSDFVQIQEESRTNTVVLDPTTGLHTEINERGPAVSAHELELFREKLLYLAQGASICVFAGSLPRGVEQDVYYTLIREVRRLGVTTMIDTDGEPLRLAMRADPDLVSPNELEAEELVGHEFNDVDDRAQAVIEMTRLGAREAIMTVSDGCYAKVIEDGAPALYRVRVQEQEARSVVGSGDAFLAGYVAARYAGQEPVECLRFGVACGAESTQHFGAGIIDAGRLERLLGEVEAERLEVGAEIG